MKFLCDEMCGDVARWLRMLGYDTSYAKDYEVKYMIKNGNSVPDDNLISECLAEFRILITRDHEMLNKIALQIDKKQTINPSYYLNFNIPKFSKLFMKNDSFEPYMLLKKGDITEELQQIVDAFQISLKYDATKARCPVCNTKLIEIPDKQEYKNQIPDKVFSYHNEFWICSNSQCGKIYWFGTHFQDILSKLAKVNQNDEM